MQIEIQKIHRQRDVELSIRLFDKKEAYLAELLMVLSTVRNVAIDIIEFGRNAKTLSNISDSQGVASEYLNKYEKANILYLPQKVRIEAAEILRDWKHIDGDNINKDMCKMYMHNIEKLVDRINRDIHRDPYDE